MSDRLAQQLDFIVQMDALKQVFRQTLLIGDRRAENDAEHSWHLALMAIILREHAAHDVDITRVLSMHLIHDLVEIHAGDTFAYDEAAHEDKEAREQAAADRIFALLPEDQERDMRALWDEFEERVTPEARYAAALDRLQPLLLNYHTDGAAWKKHDVRHAQVIERNSHIAEGAPTLWEFARQLIDTALTEGKLAG
jgi:putative hydrolases of HD superfamily